MNGSYAFYVFTTNRKKFVFFLPLNGNWIERWNRDQSYQMISGIQTLKNGDEWINDVPFFLDKIGGKQGGWWNNQNSREGESNDQHHHCPLSGVVQ